MIQKVFQWLISPLGRVAVLIGFLTLASLAVWGINQTQTAPEQPLEFTHIPHVAQAEIQCLYCHPGALRGASAGLPTVNKCWGCHQQMTITTAKPERFAPLVEAIENGTSLAWVPVAQVPDFVQFNHRPHIAAGLNCEKCHGDVSQMEIYENPQVLNMGFCIDCHKARSEDDAANNPTNDPAVSEVLREKRIKLTDCGTCHY